ncbi:MAG: hypothetical protein J3K34DRAFT_291838 [Monoraphidium minutum]|nr:MAG: hypothetical protein J3K34DRAFT_291838 [Monoraphidium minutum]
MGVSRDEPYGASDDYQCRICFEDCKPSEVISPCKCKGTLRYVHPACLRKWQANVLKLGNANDERAYTCGVCRTRYTVGPPQPNLWRHVWSGVRGLAGALAISLVAFGLSGPPFVHLALLVLLLLGTRSQALMCLLLLLMAAALGALYARGLRLVLRSDGGGHLGVALIRYGAPVDGLRPGSLLVASPGLEDSLFERSVVLITEAGRRGARGVMLTQPLEMAEIRRRRRTWWCASSTARARGRRGSWRASCAAACGACCRARASPTSPARRRSGCGASSQTAAACGGCERARRRRGSPAWRSSARAACAWAPGSARARRCWWPAPCRPWRRSHCVTH